MSLISKIKSGSKTEKITKKIKDDNIAVKVDHLVMEFKITNDKIDTLKEYVIRTQTLYIIVFIQIFLI